MDNRTPIIDILNRWPNRQAVHEDACVANPDLDMVAVHRWFQRGSLPAKYDAALLSGADSRGIMVHPMELAAARSFHQSNPFEQTPSDNTEATND